MCSTDYEARLECIRRHFSSPLEKPLVSMQKQYNTTAAYCKDVAHNLMCEYHEFFNSHPTDSVQLYIRYRQQDVPCSGGQCNIWTFHPTPSTPTADVRALQGCLVSIKQTRFLVLYVVEPKAGAFMCKLLPLSAVSCTVEHLLEHSSDIHPVLFDIIGYMGSFVAEILALEELRMRKDVQSDNVLRMLLDPSRALPGAWDYTAAVAAAPSKLQMNSSQQKAVQRLKNAVELVQGPPGTGKSTTISHVVNTRVPAGALVIITCTRNVAVASIVTKVAPVVRGEILAFGRRLEPDAECYTLDARCEQAVSRIWGGALHAWQKELAQARRISQNTETSVTERWARLWRHADAKQHCNRLQHFVASLRTQPVMRRAMQARFMCRARVMVATVHSLHSVPSTWHRLQRGCYHYDDCDDDNSDAESDCLMPDADLSVHTVIVDECGCTPESSTALLVNLRPQNLLLIGDHLQLPPFTAIAPWKLHGKNYPQSLLERCVSSGCKFSMLNEQYRMHPRIAEFVSKQFYGGRLVTPPEVALHRYDLLSPTPPLRWIQCTGRESRDNKKSSPSNMQEAQAVVEAVRTIKARPHQQHASVAVLTFYGAQKRLLQKLDPSMLVLTVDACQGAEFDHVVLSPVRANARGDVGFIKDPRRCNVACSRAKFTLTVVGCETTLKRGSSMWKNLHAACASLGGRTYTSAE